MHRDSVPFLRHDHPRVALLRMLEDGEPHSGETLGEALGISRAAVWKHISALQVYDLSIEAVRGQGYRWAEPVELLDAGVIAMGITDTIANDIDVYAELDSTNAELLRRRTDTAQCSVCLTEHQTDGRGRRKRQWLAPFASGINMSLAWRFDPAPDSLNGLSLAAGIAVVQALESIGIEGLGLKWPNDIVWQDKKLGGILIELAGESGGPCRVVIGIGINVRLPAKTSIDPGQPWIDLYGMGYTAISRNQLVVGLVTRLVEALQIYQQSGFAALHARWDQYDRIAGREVSLVLPDRQLVGTAAGVADDGALLLQSESGTQRFVAGEVSLRALS